MTSTRKLMIGSWALALLLTGGAWTKVLADVKAPQRDRIADLTPSYSLSTSARLVLDHQSLRNHLQMSDTELNQFKSFIMMHNVPLQGKRRCGMPTLPSKQTIFDVRLKKILGKARYHRLLQISWQGLKTRSDVFEQALRYEPFGRHLFSEQELKQLHAVSKKGNETYQEEYAKAYHTKDPKLRKQRLAQALQRMLQRYKKTRHEHVSPLHMKRYHALVGEPFSLKK